MGNEQFIGLGAGGHCRVAAEIVRLSGHEIAGYLVAPNDPGLDTDPTVLGTDEQLPELHSQGYRNVFIGVGMTRAGRHRQKLGQMCQEHGFLLPPLVHPRAIVSPDAQIGAGSQVLAGAIINAGAVIGEGVIVNTGAVIEHDCVIGDYTHIAPGAVIGGAVRIGICSHVGIGATVIQDVRIGDDATVGAGAVVIRMVDDGSLVLGVPARVATKT